MKTTAALLLTLAVAVAPAASAQCGDVTIYPSPPVLEGGFGRSVAIDTETLVVGNYGTLFVYDRATGQRRLALGNFGMNSFPNAPTLWGDQVVAGAPYDNFAAVFDLQTGQQLFQLTPKILVSDGMYGAAIAVDEEFIAVGSPGHWAVPASYPGLVHVYDRKTGNLMRELRPADLDGWGFNPEQALFGSSIELVDGILVASAELDSPDGSVHVYDLQTGERLYRLESPPGSQGQLFGYSLAFDGETLAVGYANGTGGVHVYDAATGLERYTIPHPSGETGSFGYQLELDGGTLAIAAWTLNQPSKERVFLADVETGVITDVLKPFPYGTAKWYPPQMALADGVLVTGERDEDILGLRVGAVKLTAIRRSLGRPRCSPAQPNSTGQSGRISATGCDGLVWELELVAEGLPSNRPGRFLASRDAGFFPFHQGSQGDLCLAGTIGAYRVESTGLFGVLSLVVDTGLIPTTPPSAIQPGETWHFQAWYRDANPGATSNFTDARAVLFE